MNKGSMLLTLVLGAAGQLAYTAADPGLNIWTGQRHIPCDGKASSPQRC